jgi:type IV pilus assembly protein PilB
LKIQRDGAKESKMVGQILVEMGLVTENTIAADSGGRVPALKRFDVKKNIIDPNLIKQVPKEIATRYKAVPVLMEDGAIYVAMADVFNVLAIDRVRRYFPKRFEIKPVHTSEKDLSELITNYYDYELSIDGILKEMESSQLRKIRRVWCKMLTRPRWLHVNPTVRLIDALLVDAIQQGASDLHFEPEDHVHSPALPCRWRVCALSARSTKITGRQLWCV